MIKIYGPECPDETKDACFAREDEDRTDCLETKCRIYNDLAFACGISIPQNHTCDE